MEKPVGFLELYVVFKYENSLSSGFPRLERDRLIWTIKKEKKEKWHWVIRINSSDLTIYGKYSQGSEKLSNRMEMIAKEFTIINSWGKNWGRSQRKIDRMRLLWEIVGVQKSTFLNLVVILWVPNNFCWLIQSSEFLSALWKSRKRT